MIEIVKEGGDFADESAACRHSTAVNGPVLDIKFADRTLPNLMNAIEVEMADKKIVAEVAQHLGDDVVRCIAMSSTDGMVRGTKAVDTGAPISVPVGNATLGRIFNVLGEVVDNGAPG